MSARVVGVIDISKSSARFAVVDLDAHAELAVRKTPNPVLRDGSYPHFDCALVWSFILESIAELNRVHPLDAICVTTHGACAALVAPDGELALPVLDYEYEGPDTERAGYDRVRPDFSETFTPRLPGGLNLGAQLYWQQKRFAGAFEGTRWILPYPQYWGFRLTGIPASEVTSLGCHTDLWNFETDLYSSLVLKQGWLAKMGEVRPAAEVLGIVKPDLCKTLGLRPRVPVHVGIQNSNASLLPHLLEREPPFAVVVSTDTWVTAAAPGGSLAGLDPARDCLANADAFGHAVPSARFMGGREHALLMSSEPGHIGEAAISRVIDEGIMLLPSVTPGSGPFPGRKAHWSHPEHLIDAETRFVAVSFYLALMTSVCLELAGADGSSILEGPLAANRLLVEMLVSATGRPVEVMSGRSAGSSVGAAMLARMSPSKETATVVPHTSANRMAPYSRRWREAVGGR